MDQEKIGKIIKEIRQKSKLTQQQFADKYGVTYQAVSKWENGKNIPDIALLKQMSQDYQIDMEALLNGEVAKKKKQKNTWIYILIGLLLLLSIGLFAYFRNQKSYEFTTLSAGCDAYKLTGSMAYDSNRTSIYISNIEYCEDDTTTYTNIHCTLYETNDDSDSKISEDSYNGENGPITLKKFFDGVSFNIDNYQRTCKYYSQESLYIMINATDTNGKEYSHKVPLTMDNNCDK